MDVIQAYCLSLSGGCLLIALIWLQLQRFEKAATRNAHAGVSTVSINLECDPAPALEALKQVQAEAERAEVAVRKAQNAVNALRKGVAGQQPPRRSPPAPPPMQDEHFRGPSKRKSAKR